MHTRAEILDLVVVDGRTRGVIVRNLETGKITRHAADAVVLASGDTAKGARENRGVAGVARLRPNCQRS